jgi:glucokinase-like ROK family protein
VADDAPATVAVDQLDALVVVLDLVRTGAACTRPDMARRSGFGRTVVTQRVQQLLDSGLLEEGALAPSTGGRAPRELRFCADAGHLLVAEVGATSVEVAVTDLNGALLHRQHGDGDVTHGPDYGLGQVEAVFDAALTARPAGAPPIWGIGVSVPGPVEFATGQPVAPPIMPGWDRYPIRKRLAQRFRVPVWVDNDVNLMALGELRSGLARGEQDVLYIKIGTGIGAGLVSGGRLHRGAQGCAGDVGHVAVLDDPTIVCRCGNIGCLEALAGGAALAREATAAAGSGRSRVLAELAGAGRPLDARDVSTAAQHGDPFSVELLTRSGERMGAMLATLVNFYNPSLIIIGGGVAEAGDLLLAAIRQVVYRRSLPLATRNLRIVQSPLSSTAGLIGASAMVVDELFSRRLLGHWLGSGSPVGKPELATGAGALLP